MQIKAKWDIGILVHICVWVALATTALMLLLINMPWQYAIIRAAVIIGTVFAGHYTNLIIFKKYLVQGKIRHYLLCLSIYLLFFTAFRYILEVYIVSPETQPFYFSGKHVRPVFLLASNIVVTFVSTVILYALHLSVREKEIMLQISNDRQAKLQYLQAQINPHFLFNTLNNIYSLSLTNSPRTPEMLLTLTDILRYSVYQNEHKKVSVMEEADQINFLIKLFNLKSDDTYNVNFEVNSTHGYIEPMILVPLAENCLKHCDFGLNDNAYARMILTTDDKTIHFTTENTFSTGITLDKVGGVGRANIIERLNLVYADKYQMLTTETPEIYKVELKIQWNS